MFRLTRHIFRWFWRTRETHSRTGYWVHLVGQWLAVALMVYWWRAMLHLIETVDAFATGWLYTSRSDYGFLDGFAAVGMHVASEPIYALQIAAILTILYLTVNRQRYGGPGFVAHRPSHGGAFLFSAIMLMRR